MTITIGSEAILKPINTFNHVFKIIYITWNEFIIALLYFYYKVSILHPEYRLCYPLLEPFL